MTTAILTFLYAEIIVSLSVGLISPVCVIRLEIVSIGLRKKAIMVAIMPASAIVATMEEAMPDQNSGISRYKNSRASQRNVRVPTRPPRKTTGINRFVILITASFDYNVYYNMKEANEEVYTQ